MRKTAILLALACALARADYGPGTIDSDLLRSGTPVVTNAWLAVSNETASLLRSVAWDKITDGTNTIDAAGKVYGHGNSCTTNYVNDIYGTLRMEAYSAENQSVSYSADGVQLFYMGGSWNAVLNDVLVMCEGQGIDAPVVTAQTSPPLVFTRQLVPQIVLIGRLALTNDIPASVFADLTPATNYANQVGARVASEATNYTDAVAQDFEDGQRISQYANNSGHADYAVELYDETATATYNATDLIRESTNAAVAVADAKISTNNAAFVSAVLAVPLAGADAGDLAELSEYGSYGTVGAAILALIAGLSALKRRVTSAETALAQKASLTDLPYRLVEPGKWEFSGVPSRWEITDISYELGDWILYYSVEGEPDSISTQGAEDALTLTFAYSDEVHITATRASLPGHLCDRAGNRVVVSGDTTLTLPAAVPGYLRDFLVRLEISGSTVPTITFSPDGNESVTYETDGDEFPVPDEAGDWLYSFTESCVPHKFAVSLKKVNTVAQGGS